MAMKMSFASLSLGASVDQQTGSLSVFDVVEEIRTPQIPMQFQSLVLSIAWEKEQAQPYEGKVFIHLLTPDGKQAVIGNGELKVPGDQKRVKAVFRIGGFPITLWGDHRFVISWVNAGGEKEGDAVLDFTVVQVAAAPAPSGDAPTTPRRSGPTTH